MTARVPGVIRRLFARRSSGRRHDRTTDGRGAGGASLASLPLAWRIAWRRLASPQGAVVAATVGSAALTASRALWHDANFTWHKPGLHVAIETAAAIIALIAAFLLAGHVERNWRLDDLILACALSLFAMTNFAFGVVPLVVGPGLPTRLETWAAFNGRLVATIAFAAAAFAPARRVRARWAGWTMVLLPAGLVAVTASGTAVLRGNPSPAVKALLVPEGGNREGLLEHPAILGGLAGLVALFVVAALGFARRAASEHDQLIGWLATASVFAAAARINGLLTASSRSDAVQLADGFRLAFYLTILVAAAREVRAYWRAAAELAVLEERRRIARDLHDGLAQELAFIRRNLHHMNRESRVVQRLEAASTRALAESRRAIAALTEPLDRPVDAVLTEVAREVAAREGGRVTLSLEQGLSATPAQREVLARICSEAIANGIRHGGAAVVHVQLRGVDEGLRLRVTDAGRGFDPMTVSPNAFGLVSMHERAEALGGRLRVRSAPGRGTELEVIL